MIILMQRLFGQNKKKNQKAIELSQRQAASKANKALKNGAEYDELAKNIRENFGGDIDAWLAKNTKQKSKYLTGTHREGLQNVINGANSAEQEAVKKALHSSDAAQQALGDQVHKYGKTRSDVRNQGKGGVNFEASGKKVNAVEGALGDTKVKTVAPVTEGSVKREVLTATDERRKNDIQRLEQKNQIPVTDNRTTRGQGSQKSGRDLKNERNNRGGNKRNRSTGKVQNTSVATTLDRGGVSQNSFRTATQGPNSIMEATIQRTPGQGPVLGSGRIEVINNKPATEKTVRNIVNNTKEEVINKATEATNNAAKKGLSRKGKIGLGLAAGGALLGSAALLRNKNKKEE